MTEPKSLAALERQLARQISLMAYPASHWVAPVSGPDGTEALDCAIIGGGMCDLVTAAMLRREKLGRLGSSMPPPAGGKAPG